MWNLERFVFAQQRNYGDALRELRSGKKRSHWIWYVFPQIRGLGDSFISRKYALSGLEEARAYLAHPILGPRLLECCQAVLDFLYLGVYLRAIRQNRAGWPGEMRS